MVRDGSATYPPLLRVSGSNYEIGYQVGSCFKDRIAFTLKNFQLFKRNKALSAQNPSLLETIEAESVKLFPQYVDELRGYADGASVSFEDIFIHNCVHAPGLASCSTGIFTFEDRTVVVQNEDWWSILGDNAYFLIQELENGISFFALAYPGILPGMSFGFNSAGIFFCCNGLQDPTRSVGPSRILFGRAVFEQRTIRAAVTAAHSHAPRSGGANYNMVSMATNEVVNLETTGNDAHETVVTDRFFHSNHYVSDRFGVLYPTSEEGPILTLSRYEAGSRLILEADKTTAGLRSVLWDDSVFLTKERTRSENHTMCTAVVEITRQDDIRLRFHPGVRDPGEYRTISLSELATEGHSRF